MKTAYEIAMERLGGGKSYTEEQKHDLAEIDGVYEAKKAEAKLGAETRLKAAAGNAEEEDSIREDLAAELRKIEARKEAEKNNIRNRG